MLALPFGLDRWEGDFRDERGGAWSRLENEGKVQPRKKTGKEGEMKQKKEDKKSDEKRREGNKE